MQTWHLSACICLTYCSLQQPIRRLARTGMSLYMPYLLQSATAFFRQELLHNACICLTYCSLQQQEVVTLGRYLACICLTYCSLQQRCRASRALATACICLTYCSLQQRNSRRRLCGASCICLTYCSLQQPAHCSTGGTPCLYMPYLLQSATAGCLAVWSSAILYMPYLLQSATARGCYGF